MSTSRAGVFPPNTLFRLLRIESNFVAPNGVEVKQPLYVVSATFRKPVQAGKRDVGKMCGSLMELEYGGKDIYINGLDGLVSLKPPLTMAQECSRDLVWTDWKGEVYRLCDEWEYINGPAVRQEGCTAGIRDDENDGMLPEDFVARINQKILQHNFINKTHLDSEACVPGQVAAIRRTNTAARPKNFLTTDEVLAIRLYSGPAYQPINSFLRQLSAVTDLGFRRMLARNPQITFAATCRLLSSAIRKLASATLLSEFDLPLYRGVRGELKPSFWNKDEDGMIVACDGAFMSTSSSRATPIDYMNSDCPNVLWKLLCRRESDDAHHRGADISTLSQYSSEGEILFPPCTMLVVQENRSIIAHDLEDQSMKARGESGGNKKFTEITVVPWFV